MAKKHFFLILFIILSSKTLEAVPDWYNGHIKDTDIHFYGVGSGLNLNDAITMALNNISNKITLNNSNLRVNFPSFEFEKNDNEGKYFYVMLSVAKAELLNQQIKDLDDISKKIKDTVDSLEDKNNFVKLKKLIALENVITEARNKLKTIDLIGKFNDKEYVKYYDFVENEKSKLINNFEVKIVFLNDSLTIMKNSITNSLKNNKIKITDKSDNILYVDAIYEKEQIEKNYFVVAIFQFKLVSSGELASYSSQSYSSYSNLGFDKAIENCIEEFQKDITINRVKLVK